MSLSLTEEASKRRGDAGSALIQNELDYSILIDLLGSFKITSATSDNLSKNEFKALSSIKGGFDALQKSVTTTLLSVSSAVSSSMSPGSSSATLRRILSNMDSLNISLQTPDTDISNFNNKNDFQYQYGVITSILADLEACLLLSGSIIDDLLVLLFG